MDIIIPKNKSYKGELRYTENNEASGQADMKKFKIFISISEDESIEMFAIQLDKLDIGIPYTGILSSQLIQESKLKNIDTINDLYDAIYDSIEKNNYILSVTEEKMKIHINYTVTIGSNLRQSNFDIELNKLESNLTFKIIREIMLHFKHLSDESETKISNLEKNINFINSKLLPKSLSTPTPENEKISELLKEKFTLLDTSTCLIDTLLLFKKQIERLEMNSESNESRIRKHEEIIANLSIANENSVAENKNLSKKVESLEISNSELKENMRTIIDSVNKLSNSSEKEKKTVLDLNEKLKQFEVEKALVGIFFNLFKRKKPKRAKDNYELD